MMMMMMILRPPFPPHQTRLLRLPQQSWWSSLPRRLRQSPHLLSLGRVATPPPWSIASLSLFSSSILLSPPPPSSSWLFLKLPLRDDDDCRGVPSFPYSCYFYEKKTKNSSPTPSKTILLLLSSYWQKKSSASRWPRRCSHRLARRRRCVSWWV